ncbi:ubiquinone/menaquinone biosynthesis methyltransferase [Candidatus Methanoperedens nitroreducens]|uniref:Demethylmenaquinone methyltransferase n=1 Tax=Candidatus Methanoperedens nitratireducens TaxID=1392998 RepID=A0A062V1D2_9EURY|nr:bifunctional demethylmenaquinone methyltransferase/2-methoxy-6-polyprenyl-1,4-benzoquinol methylase UbiE [Candidatus Methanoperedens nitroreducens]KCZ72911.1 ubiquinone/menaquinone biosynthesis methyltransferase [Candidatus Methanoperedens nitroreducens]MDJ1423161.1 bifunctional demethylmenaquinone methyltransferase/2-methoxy-6-polyprenyl-1,4-benzoquinol methylase UbiE [Candidatus Methanoperedens sp.]
MQKKEYIKKMFAGISYRYDLLNYLLSLGQDRYWRRFAADKLPSGLILDICSGTGDVAVEVSKVSNKSQIIAADFCEEMLKLCAQKIKDKNIKNIYCIQNDAENLSFKDETFNGAIVAFGIRNVSDIKKALTEMNRVIKIGGEVVVLEFSQPENPILRSIYYFYFKKILPVIGALISKRTGPYSYLPSSVMAFPKRSEFVEIMKESGMKNIGFYCLTFGIVTVYTGIK